MIGNKWLSEAIHTDEFQKGFLNLVYAPVGSGKTTWALNVLAETVSNKNKMLYLIDTTNGKEQILEHHSTQHFTKDWLYLVTHNMVDFEDAKVVVMTYAKFGTLVEFYKSRFQKDFGDTFEFILCDEIHNLPRFSAFLHSPRDTNYHRIAKERIEEIVSKQTGPLVIGLSATPKRAETGMLCKTKYVTVDGDARQLETRNIVPYANLESLIPTLPKDKKYLVYASHITKMKQLTEIFHQRSIKAIAIWSEKNQEKPMNEEQLRARQYILSNKELPPEYGAVIINASSETSINLYGHIDAVIVHTREKEAQVQVRGRYRKDLDTLYILDYEAISFPPDFLERKLFEEDKRELSHILGLRDKNSRLVGWNTVKKKLLEQGFTIKDGREKNRRYSIIQE